MLQLFVFESEASFFVQIHFHRGRIVETSFQYLVCKWVLFRHKIIPLCMESRNFPKLKTVEGYRKDCATGPKCG